MACSRPVCALLRASLPSFPNSVWERGNAREFACAAATIDASRFPQEPPRLEFRSMTRWDILPNIPGRAKSIAGFDRRTNSTALRSSFDTTRGGNHFADSRLSHRESHPPSFSRNSRLTSDRKPISLNSCDTSNRQISDCGLLAGSQANAYSAAVDERSRGQDVQCPLG